MLKLYTLRLWADWHASPAATINHQQLQLPHASSVLRLQHTPPCAEAAPHFAHVDWCCPASTLATRTSPNTGRPDATDNTLAHPCCNNSKPSQRGTLVQCVNCCNAQLKSQHNALLAAKCNYGSHLGCTTMNALRHRHWCHPLRPGQRGDRHSEETCSCCCCGGNNHAGRLPHHPDRLWGLDVHKRTHKPPPAPLQIRRLAASAPAAMPPPSPHRCMPPGCGDNH